MLTKLLSLFPNAILYQKNPGHALSLGHFYFFYDQIHNQWIGIPQSDITERELEILKTLYEYYEPLSLSEFNPSSTQEMLWHDFLFLKGAPPADGPGSHFRMIQFKITGHKVERLEFESALRGFFSDEVLITWENSSQGVIIERDPQKNSSLMEKEFISLAQTVESDFYIKIAFYYGKQFLFTNSLPENFQEEKEFFTFALNILGHGVVFSFEKVFPAYVAHYLPLSMKQKLHKTFFEVFREDKEMFSTIKALLENNLNASSTAKKLYVHRNTLQYRVDKFTDKTGIQLKDFYSAFTVFLACLVYELEDSE